MAETQLPRQKDPVARGMLESLNVKGLRCHLRIRSGQQLGYAYIGNCTSVQLSLEAWAVG